MRILSKLRSLKNVIIKKGVLAFIFFLIDRFKVPITLNQKIRWKAGIRSEIRFWDDWFKTKGLRWPDEYFRRLNPDLPLQPRPSALLPNQVNIKILDVGAGPLTVLGKKCLGKSLTIIATNPLADHYDRLLMKHNIHPIVRTQKLSAENLRQEFPSDFFDLAFGCNSIDHSYEPEEAIMQMIEIVKKGCYVLLEHRVNEATHENHAGFHQWDFSLSGSGDFLITSVHKQVNMTQKYANQCKITCDLINNQTRVTRIRKL